MANIFRLQENVPEAYIKGSRDFQLLCNIFDVMNSGIKYDIDSIRDVTDTTYCHENLLEYLKTKLGFNSKVKFNNTQLRQILQAFPSIIKYKGSKKGILYCIYTYLNIIGINTEVNVDIVNVDVVNGDNYVVNVSLQTPGRDLTVLKELLKFVIPTGYNVHFSFYDKFDKLTTLVPSNDTIEIIFVSEPVVGGLRSSNVTDSLTNAVSNTPIVPNNINIEPEKGKPSNENYKRYEGI